MTLNSRTYCFPALGLATLVDFGLATIEGEDAGDGANPRAIDYAGLERADGRASQRQA